jgi:VIT1/CCC1 family predicted Fe2+/Mn2+ transporter
VKQSAGVAELNRLLRNWKDERNSAALYKALASLENRAVLRSVFGKLAAAELDHSKFWERRLTSLGLPAPAFRPSLRTRLLIQLARRFGVAFVIPSIASRELADRDRYSKQLDAKAAGLASEERGHAAVVRTLGSYVPLAGAGTDESTPSGVELANRLRAGVLGANDGLVSNFCLLMGVAGGGALHGAILLTGITGLAAGACAMALGEWLSVTNAHEMAVRQVDRDIEGAAAALNVSELALVYQAKGMTETEAARAAEKIFAEGPNAASILMREALTFVPVPLTAASVSFVLFALGALVPLLPYFLADAREAILGSIGASLIALFLLGLTTSFFNGRSALFSGLRQMLIGGAAALVTFGIGSAFAMAVS